MTTITFTDLHGTFCKFGTAAPHWTICYIDAIAQL